MMRETESMKKYHLSSTLRKLVHSPKKHLSFSLDKDHKPLNQLILDKLEKFEIYSKSAENSFLGGISKKDEKTKTIGNEQLKRKRKARKKYFALKAVNHALHFCNNLKRYQTLCGFKLSKGKIKRNSPAFKKSGKMRKRRTVFYKSRA
jgi:hypothetical protein